MDPRCNEYEQTNKMSECMMPPICECGHETVCDRYIVHEVPHIIPMHTRIVNHHIFKHTYTPVYTSSECDTCENVYGGKNF